MENKENSFIFHEFYSFPIFLEHIQTSIYLCARKAPIIGEN